MDVARRYLKNTVLSVAVLLFICVIFGILAKVYEVSGLKDWKRRRAESDVDDGQIDGGSARRLLAAESDLGGGTTDEETYEGLEGDINNNNKNGTARFSSSPRKELPMASMRRQHSNSDSESIASYQQSGSILPRSRSDLKRMEEQRRSRTLSESGVVVTKHSSLQQMSDPALSLMRHSSNPHRTTRTALAELQKSISESSSQQDNFSVPSDPNLPTTAQVTNIPTIGEEDEESEKSIRASSSSITPSMATAVEGVSFNGGANIPVGRNVRNDRKGDTSFQHKKRRWLRFVWILIVLSVSVVSFLLVACVEMWINPEACSQFQVLHRAVSMFSFDLIRLWDDVLAGERNDPASVRPVQGKTTNWTSLGNSQSLKQLLKTGLLNPVVLGVLFVTIASCMVLCRGSRRTQADSGATAESFGARRKQPPAPIKTSLSNDDASFYDAPAGPQPSPMSTLSRRSGQPQVLHSRPEYVSNLTAKLEKVGRLSCCRCDPNGVELPSAVLTKNIIQQCAAFCLLITDDPYGRFACVEELRHALKTKSASSIVVVSLDSALDVPLNEELQKLLDSPAAREVTHLTWPGAVLSKRNSSLGVFEEERRTMTALCDLIRAAKSTERFSVWDVFISHFQQRATIQAGTPSLIRSAMSSSSQIAGPVTLLASLGLIVSKVMDVNSIAAASVLINAMIAAKYIGVAEGNALLMVLQGKEHDEQVRLLEQMERQSAEQSVVEVPISPTFFLRGENNNLSDADDDDTSDGHSQQRQYQQRYRNMSTEVARQMNQQQLHRTMHEQTLDGDD